jgi:predicted nucleic acid-binding protein
MYLDAAYIVKNYLNEPESQAVRALVRQAERLISSALAIAEVHCVFLRQQREGKITRDQCLESASLFDEHVDRGVWTMVPVSDDLLRRTSTLVISAPDVILRAGDAIHLLTAQKLGEREIWTGDRHMLAAAPHFGVIGRSV